MAKVSASIVQLGRGLKIPFTVENGGAAWNLPLNPTPAEIQTAVEQDLIEVVGTFEGSQMGDRSFGARADEELQELQNDAVLDDFSEGLEEDITEALPYLVYRDKEVGYREVNDALVVRIWWQLREFQDQESAVQQSELAVTAGGTVEVLSG